MAYDDRLVTILRPKPGDVAPARDQYQQLLDLLGTSGDARADLLDEAYRQLAALSAMLPVADRVALIAEPALRLRSPRLVAALVQGEPQVAGAAVRAACLGDEQWLDLIPALPLPARIVMRDRSDLGARLRDVLARLGNDEGAAPLSRDGSASPAPVVRRFDFLTDAAGRIGWSEPGVAPMVIGIDLGEFPELVDALRQHQPIRAARVTLEGAYAIAGAWQIDASPSFAPDGGGYLGHIGRFRRRQAAQATFPSPAPENARAACLRQVLHELRNPVNAIQGFAEIIQQQLFGPTPHEYRALAAVIAADAARMLAGFEELERLARLASRSMELVPGQSDLTACVTATVDRLKPHTDPRASGFVMPAHTGELRLGLAPIETERLCWRLLATLAGCASPGETLRLDMRRSGLRAQLTIQLPGLLADLDDDALLHAASEASHTLSTGMFGTGFALRLAASEAAAAGGRLDREARHLHLYLPTMAEAPQTLRALA